MDELLLAKYERLKSIIKDYGSVAVAFSGGGDSTLLVYAAKTALGDNVFALTAKLKSFPESELKESIAFCDSLSVKQEIVELNELLVPGFKENPKDRCYICKSAIFGKLKSRASEVGAVIVEGSNVDDEGDYRPGLRAIKELEIKSPLKEAGLTKQEIRELSKSFGLPTFNKPAMACLSSRIPFGEEITEEKLMMVSRGEDYLRGLGFIQCRVRLHGNLARIELLAEDFEKLMLEKRRIEVHEAFKEIGFSYIALDLLGYRTGSLNEVIRKEKA